MNKIYISIVLAIVVVIGIFTLNNTNTAEYVTTIDDEVTQLENELAELELAVEAGTLTSEQATEAKVKILTRLDAINTAAATSERATLTSAQRKQLSEGLDRLKNILITYQATLTVVDDTSVEADVEAKLKRGNGSKNRNLNLVVAETIDNVQEVAEDVIEDFETNEDLDTQVEVIVEEEENIGETEGENNENSTSTDETVTETDESTEDPEENPSDDEEMSDDTPTLDNDDDGIIIESSTTIETEEEITL